MGFLKTPVWRL